MYGIKLCEGLSMSLSGKVGIVKAVHAEIYWEDDEGEKTVAYTCQGYLADKSPSAARKWARDEGMRKMAELRAYLKKHGERREVVLDRERKAKEAERRRIEAIRMRIIHKRDEIL